jgi:hypothetical protein
MDAIRLLQEMGDVPQADEAVIDAAIELVLAAAVQERTPTPLEVPITKPRRRRRRVLGAAGRATAAAAVLAVVILVPPGGHRPPTVRLGGPRPDDHAPKALTAGMVRLISSQSAAAMADSGTAVETTTNITGSTAQGSPTTIDVTFSGQNVNYLFADNGNGAAGVENRVVNGQLYLYIKGPDLQMHWYHDTSPAAAASLTFPDPRTLLQAVSPAAGLEDVGQESVAGVELTHLRATNPGPIGTLGIPGISSTVTAFDLWVDSADVVRQMDVSSSPSGISFVCTASHGGDNSSSGGTTTVSIPPADRVSILPDGKPVPPGVTCATAGSLHLGSTFDVQFANLGDPESVVAPSGAIDQQGLG